MSIEPTREFHLTTQDFQRVRKLIYDHAGIALSESKLELVYSRLSRRLRVTGVKTFAEYLAILEAGNTRELEDFTNSLTTNLTSFFREAHHFPMLADHLRAQHGKHPITIWCCASSTGEEPYTIAMTAMDALGSSASSVTIIATDLDTQVLEIAKAGIYPEDRVSKLAPDIVKRFFEKGTGIPAGHVRVRQELRDMISFRQVNLLHSNWPLRFPIAAIFCRNVMIYFDKPTQLQILKKFAPLLHSDGLLFAGHSESFHHAEEYFRLRSRTVYELAPQAKARGIAVKSNERIEWQGADERVDGESVHRITATERIIVVGASTGGTEAVKDFLVGMPADAPGILIAQHMPEAFTKSFAERLNGLCKITVSEAEDGQRVLPGHAYIAPGHSHLLLKRKGAYYVTELSQIPPVNHHRPSVEVLFRSAAQHGGKSVIGVMLTGMGKDGAIAMLEMHQAGAYNFAQDQESSVVFGMPREAIALGAVDEVVPIKAMAQRVLACLNH